MKRFPKIAAVMLLISVLVLAGVYFTQPEEDETIGADVVLAAMSGSNSTLLTDFQAAQEQEKEPEIGSAPLSPDGLL